MWILFKDRVVWQFRDGAWAIIKSYLHTEFTSHSFKIILGGSNQALYNNIGVARFTSRDNVQFLITFTDLTHNQLWWSLRGNLKSIDTQLKITRFAIINNSKSLGNYSFRAILWKNYTHTIWSGFPHYALNVEIHKLTDFPLPKTVSMHWSVVKF